ncbi:MAG: DUF3859 domain-containing protein [Pseudomonadaceae bacterium]|nr:DUF3859 domain-containing protein [Pseudomonadaceae bacterium]
MARLIRFPALITLLICAAQTVQANTTIEGADITLFGTFAYERKPDGTFSITHVESTTEITAVLGSEFGHYFVLHGSPGGAAVDLTVILRLPLKGKMRRSTLKAEIGKKHYAGYVMDTPSEILPAGPVIQEVWYDGRQLASKQFQVLDGELAPCPVLAEGIECIADGLTGNLVAMLGKATSRPIYYSMSKEELKAEFTRVVSKSDWTLEGWHEGREPDGTRYRASISKETESIAVSIYSTPDGSVLQLTTFPSNP